MRLSPDFSSSVTYPDCGVAPVDEQHLSVDIAGLFTGQKARGIRNILDGPETPCRDQIEIGVPTLLAERGEG